MLLTADRILETPTLNDLLDRADINRPNTSYGRDIDIANATMLDPLKTHQERCSAFLSWASRYQPCLFGRFGAREMQGIGIDVCWIDEDISITGLLAGRGDVTRSTECKTDIVKKTTLRTPQ
jgi:hypothetical protein